MRANSSKSYLEECQPLSAGHLETDSCIEDQSPTAGRPRRIEAWIRAWNETSPLCIAILSGIFGICIYALLLALFFKHKCLASQAIDFSGYRCAPDGMDPGAARKRGCEFDRLSWHWYRKQALLDADNVALLQQFEDAGPWHRFYDRQGQREISPDSEVLTTGWETRKDHVFYCAYTIRQTHLWITKGYDPPFNYSHTVDCTQYLLDVILENPPKDFDDLAVQVAP